MRDYKRLKVGDRIRILNVPEGDLQQREREVAENMKDAGWTANTIEQVIIQHPVVVISEVDEYGSAWFDVELKNVLGEMELHSLAIYDNLSWEYHIK